MARKRKIPARKHHGIRDPLKQLEEKEKKLKNVVNNPPEKGGDQKVSFKFAQFKKLADDAKAGKKLKRIHRGREDKPRSDTTKAAARTQKSNASRVENSKLRIIKQIAGEEDEDYLKRVNRMTTESLREAEYEAKYGVTVVHNPKTGEISIKKRPKNEIDELLQQKQKPKKSNTKTTKPTMDAKTAKALIKQAIKEGDDEKKNETIMAEFKRDTFRFGEVVHAPPTLSTLPRKATKSETVPRPGQKNNLLLQSMMNPKTTASKSIKTSGVKLKLPKGQVSKAQLKGKRKELPAATRTMLEQEQTKIIELYRNLKKSKEK